MPYSPKIIIDNNYKIIDRHSVNWVNNFVFVQSGCIRSLESYTQDKDYAL